MYALTLTPQKPGPQCCENGPVVTTVPACAGGGGSSTSSGLPSSTSAPSAPGSTVTFVGPASTSSSSSAPPTSSSSSAPPTSSSSPAPPPVVTSVVLETVTASPPPRSIVTSIDWVLPAATPIPSDANMAIVFYDLYERGLPGIPGPVDTGYIYDIVVGQQLLPAGQSGPKGHQFDACTTPSGDTNWNLNGGTPYQSPAFSSSKQTGCVYEALNFTQAGVLQCKLIAAAKNANKDVAQATPSFEYIDELRQQQRRVCVKRA
ncbi:hypothetical protein P7C71_g5835, partial [Lecanoromycetidae sp. Uapishka_2]